MRLQLGQHDGNAAFGQLVFQLRSADNGVAVDDHIMDRPHRIVCERYADRDPGTICGGIGAFPYVKDIQQHRDRQENSLQRLIVPVLCIADQLVRAADQQQRTQHQLRKRPVRLGVID